METKQNERNQQNKTVTTQRTKRPLKTKNAQEMVKRIEIIHVENYNDEQHRNNINELSS